jgi:hypothetical protein
MLALVKAIEEKRFKPGKQANNSQYSVVTFILESTKY